MRFHCLVIALALLATNASDSWGQSKQPPPSKQATEPTAADKRGTDGVPLAVKIIPAPDAKEQADKAEHERKEKAVIDEKLTFETQRIADYTARLALFTAILMLVAIGQAGLFVWQLRYMRGDVERAERTFLFANRPLLKIKFAELNVEGNTVSVSFNVVNAGGSAAHVTGSAAAVDIFAPDDWPNPHAQHINNIIPQRRFLPGATDLCMVNSATANPLDAYSDGARQIMLYGWVVYKDDAGTPRTTYFCRVHDRKRDRMVPPDRPEYDSTD